jgi:NAD(P)-dependent dehydrogenase (short-subunit alcohol dehydrogenase family)
MRGLQADYQATRWGQSATDRRAHTKLRLGCRHSFGGRTIARHRLLGCCIITGRDKARLDEAIAGIGHGAIGIQGDASKLADLDRIYTTVGVEAGRIDVLFANAGFYEHGSFGEITAEHFDKTFNTNVRGVLFTVQKALPLLRPGASVILTGSIASIKGIPSMGVYDATKAAVRSFARSWIVDLKGRDIRVNVLSPGHIVTPGLSKLLDEQQQNHVASTVKLGRLGTAYDMGKVAVLLASAGSSYVNGIELFADGGVAQI